MVRVGIECLFPLYNHITLAINFLFSYQLEMGQDFALTVENV